MKVIVYSEGSARISELVAAVAAVDAAADVSAIVLGTPDEAQEAAAYVNAVYFIEAADFAAEAYLPAMADVVCSNAPDLVLCGCTTFERAFAAHVAVKLGTTPVPGATALFLDGDAVAATRNVYGGGAVQTMKSIGTPFVVSAAPGISDEYVEPGQAGAVEPYPVSAVSGPKRLSVSEKSAAGADVSDARIVVCAGRGFSSKEDLALADELAGALGGGVGYTRPVTEVVPPIVEGAPYIGVSGLQVKPDLYIGLAVSGQTQHVVGIRDSKTVVCVNSDPNALMFRHSDYGIVADYHEAVPAIIEALANA